MAKKKTSPTSSPSTSTESVMGIENYFAHGTHPFEGVTFERRDALIEGPGDEPVFEQRDVSFPAEWSQNATNIVSQKYFAGQMGSKDREWSVKQLIGRVVEKIGSEGMKNGYFDNEYQQQTFEHELAYILVHQMAAFNSPVWFNIGVKGVDQQCSACQPYHALVSTPQGMVPIGELVESDQVGRTVYDRHGETKIVATKCNGTKEVFRVSLRNGQYIEATSDHQIFVHTSDRPDGVWMELADAEAGMSLQLHTQKALHASSVPQAVPVGARFDFVPDVNPVLFEASDSVAVAEAALAGWLQADGFVGQYTEGTNRSLTIEFQVATTAEKAWVLDNLKIALPHVRHNIRMADTKEQPVERIRLYGEALRDFVERWGLMSRRGDIRVPAVLFTSDLDAVGAYLRSIFQADGFATASGHRIAFSVISEKWTEDVQLLLLMMGIYSKRRMNQEPREDRENTWQVDICFASERAKFAELIGFVDPAKQQRLLSGLQGLYRPQTVKAVRTEEIIDISSAGDMQVYDIQTESGEYLSNNIVVHNCFILHIEDSLDDITRWYSEEAKIFQNGSGSGLNLSALRASSEPLSRGGKSSGPVTFMRAADSSAGTITSGGRCLAPDQRVYTAAGPVAVKDLAEAGRDFVVFSYDPPAGRYAAKTARAWKQPFTKRLVEVRTDKGSFRLSEDHPVRLSTGRFVKAGSLTAGQSLFAGTISYTHDGYLRIGLKDGHKTKMRLHRLVAGDLLEEDIDGMSVHHRDGNPFNNIPENLEVMSQSEHAALHGKQEAEAGRHVFQQRSFAKSGAENPMHADSDFWKDQDRVDAYKARQAEVLLTDGDRASEMQRAAAQQKMLNTAFEVLNAGYSIDTFDQYVAGRKEVVGRIPSITKLRSTIDDRFGSYDHFVKEVAANNHRVVEVRVLSESDVYDVEVDCPTADDKSPESGHNFLIWSSDEMVGSGIVVSNTRRAAKMVVLDVDHPDVEDFIWCKAEEEKKARALAAAGFDMSLNTPEGERNWASLQYQNANNSVRLSDEFLKAVEADADFHLTARATGEPVKTVKARELLAQIAEAAWECADPGVQYDTTINSWHTCPNHSRITASNPCSEYMHVDNSSCNLASLNLMKFRREDGTFNVEAFRRAVGVVFTAQEILISFADYPTEEIGKNTRAMRQIGLGYANLGAYLMASGVPYDSEEGRDLAGAITALMHCEAYAQSARIAERMGTYDEYRSNQDAQLRVIKRHRTAANKLNAFDGDPDLTRAAKRAAKDMVELSEKHGVRNSQVTVSAPTGCLTPDAMVLTDQGLARMGELGRLDGDQWQEADFRVQTDEGPQQATQFYVNGKAQVARMVSGRGYEIAGTPQHRVKRVAEDGSFEWARLSDLREGDVVPIRRGGMLGKPRRVALPPLSEPYFAGLQDVFAPQEMTVELARLVGYFMGDGSLHSKGLRLQVSGDDPDVVDRISELGESLFGLKAGLTPYPGHYQVELHSTQLAGWWKASGFSKRKPSADHSGKGWVPHIPAAIRASNDPEIYGAFLCGLFEADGGAYENHTVSFSSAKKSFADEVKALLMAMGIPTNTKIDLPGNGHKGDGPVYVLRVLNRNATQDYMAKVGFMGARKQRLLELAECDTSTQFAAFKHDLMPMSRELVDELCPDNGDLRRNLLQGLKRNRVSRFLVERLFDETGDQRLAHMLEYFFDTVKSCDLAEETMTYDLSVPYNTTYVANGFLSHNTISFLMDCDTTGVEPDFSLMKYKKLVGGGSMTIVNQTVPQALARLGYDPQQSSEIVDFISEHNSVVGAPHLSEDHYPVFDTAIGQRPISYMGHLKMMAAIQPFMSGAISKTVNLPSDVTREDIFDVYMEAWKMGLKAVAIYRDGTKTAQPLGDGSDDEEAITSLLGDGLLRGQRRRVPDDGKAVKRRFEINSAASGKVSGHIVVGLFEDGTPGEVFVNVAQAGSTLRGFIDTWSRLFSMALQYGAPLEELVAKQAFTQFEPAGFTNDREIARAKSIPDYVVRWMAARFLDEGTHMMLGIGRPEPVEEQEEGDKASETVRPELKVTAPVSETTSPQAGTATCPKCGSLMVQTGKCMTCTGCGDTGGCG